MKRVFVDLHVLQSVPPNCINRDDSNSPKTAFYGGVRRARVSSQAWKRDMRIMFRDYYDASELCIRTKRVFELIADEMLKTSADLSKDEAIAKAKDALKLVKILPSKKKDKENESEALVFLSSQQVKNIAAVALGAADVKEVIKALKENNGVEIALFGRMAAKTTELNCDACVQVAHAISTHRVENEYDFFIAEDDYASKIKDHKGGAHIDTMEFNSATLYRYATIAAHELYDQLSKDGEATAKAIREFTRAFICSMPKGKQHSYAAHTVPEAVLAVIRDDRPLNLADAFEKPVNAKEEDGLVKNSACAFAERAKEVYKDFCAPPKKGFVIGKYWDELGDHVNLNEMLQQLSTEAIAVL